MNRALRINSRIASPKALERVWALLLNRFASYRIEKRLIAVSIAFGRDRWKVLDQILAYRATACVRDHELCRRGA